jgi:hypothetical protein
MNFVRSRSASQNRPDLLDAARRIDEDLRSKGKSMTKLFEELKEKAKLGPNPTVKSRMPSMNKKKRVSKGYNAAVPMTFDV